MYICEVSHNAECGKSVGFLGCLQICQNLPAVTVKQIGLSFARQSRSANVLSDLKKLPHHDVSAGCLNPTVDGTVTGLLIVQHCWKILLWTG